MHDVPVFVLAISEPECDIAFSDAFSRLLQSAYAHPNLVLDLTAVRYIDSTCLGKLARLCAERIGRGLSTARIIAPSEDLRRLFSLVKFDQIFAIYSNAEDALKEAAT